MLTFSNDTERALLEACQSRFGASGVAAARGTIAYVRSLTAGRSGGDDPNTYIVHSLRVATFAVRMRRPPRIETMIIALLHNVYEVAGIGEPELEAAGYDRRVAEAIRLLTIDRAREEDQRYLTKFYRDIERSGTDLSLVRCLDKLDNILGLELSEVADRLRYIDLAVRFVAPMARHLSPDFGRYFDEVASYIADGEIRPNLRERYDRARCDRRG